MHSTSVRIGDKDVGHGHPCFIVAEIGINHNGDLNIAKKLIDVAYDAGADAVKFQKRTIPIVYSEQERMRPREIPPEVVVAAIRRKVFGEDVVTRLAKSEFLDTTNGDQKYALELTQNEYAQIDAHCKNIGIQWFASSWDEDSVDFLDTFNPPCYKVASASLTDDSLLRHIRSKNRPIILSTGMSTMEQIHHAVDVLGRDQLVILHCTSTYPSEERELNLSVIQTLQKTFPEVPIGYSGHERGISTSVNAVALGARMVERHLTLDRTMWGSDQAASVEPRGFGLLVRDIRKFEEACGDGIKRVWESELPIIQKLRRK
ncbi:MAG: N-acetylneuraminate synthase [Parcubacteria group bacterium Gr01-1014_66]|nr:MAG: N-acetylneuraminate synthase [Parcubacteria group bacterium Gr01-1014_66]